MKRNSISQLEQHRKDVDVKKLMDQYLKAGWINVDKLYDFIMKDYVNNREKYKSIEDFMP